MPGVVRADALRDLLHDCVASTAVDQTVRLAEAARLLAPLQDRSAITAMIACGAYESAALLVLGPDRPFLVSRGAGGVSLASTVLADGEEATAEAATPALALLAAHAAALLADTGRTGVPLWRAPVAPAARLH